LLYKAAAGRYIERQRPAEKRAAVQKPPILTAASLVPHLSRCGYGDTLLERDYDFGPGLVSVAAFSDTPHDTRSACIAAIDAPTDPGQAVEAAGPLGAPVVFACPGGQVQWWKQTTGRPVLQESIDARHVRRFFDCHRKDFRPANIFEGKTLRRLPTRKQLDFVDAGLMPFVERTAGERLGRLVEKALGDIEAELGRKIAGEADARDAIKATFWLLGAKALHDKCVPKFRALDLSDIDEVFALVGKHYGVPDGLPPRGRRWRAATAAAAARISDCESLRNLSTEALAHVYENTMVTPEVRKANGTHSTPGPLVDYIVWQLWPWIEDLPPERRHIFEPACGHAAFLVSALRVLRQWSDISDAGARHRYLREHLHGVESDRFALEVARLSLTLADVPHGNTWDLQQADMFLGRALEDGAGKCGVLLANPPYERFTPGERAAYEGKGAKPQANTKACEMLRRTIPHLTKGSCFGVVVPLRLLHSKEGIAVRRELLADFELSETSVFGDQLFEKSDTEAAVLLGRRRTGKAAPGKLWFRRVRNAGMEDFRGRLGFSSQEQVDVSTFTADRSADLRVPELGAVWRYLSEYPTLGEAASLGQGLFHRGESLPAGSWTTRLPPKKGDVLGFANVPDDLEIYGRPLAAGINIDPSAVDRAVAGLPTGRPQVLVNYAPVSREAWRLKATLDEEGRALTSRFIAVRPRRQEVTALYLWAILNSPVANAFAHCHLGKRDNLVGTMRRMPVPAWSAASAAQIEQAAMRCRALATSTGPLYEAGATAEGIRRALLEMDAAVLQAYDLPPRLERQLLDLFAGVERKGVGCDFTGYYPPGFTSCLPLHLVLSDSFQRARADATAERFRPGESEYVAEVLASAAAGGALRGAGYTAVTNSCAR